KVRLNATVTQNVVTYTVEIVTQNKDLKLLPYLTANVRFETGRREQVLTVPNAALRWTPSSVLSQNAASSASERGTLPGNAPGAEKSVAPSGPAPTTPAPTAGEKTGEGTHRHGRREATVYVLENGSPRAIHVRAGLSDGS